MSLPLLLSLPVSRVPWISTPSSVLANELPVLDNRPALGKGNHNTALSGKRQSRERDKSKISLKTPSVACKLLCKKSGEGGKADLNRGMNP